LDFSHWQLSWSPPQPILPLQSRNGSVPPGLGVVNLPGALAFNNVPPAAGLYSFQVTVADTSKNNVTSNYSINVANQPIIISPSSLPIGAGGIPCSVAETQAQDTLPAVVGSAQVTTAGSVTGRE